MGFHAHPHGLLWACVNRLERFVGLGDAHLVF